MGVLPEVPSDFTPKSFWEKKEGTTGMVVGVGLIGGLLFGLYHILPFIISLLANTITAVALGVVLFIMVWVLMDRRFWNLLWYGYKSLMRMITSLWATLDPIGILKNYVSNLRDNAEEMSKQVSNLRGQMRQLKDLIDSNIRERENAIRMAGRAKKEAQEKVFVLKARKAGRLGESNMTLQNLYNRMEVLYRVLMKMYETSLMLIEDLQDEVDVKSRERAAIMASYSAYKHALNIINGEKDKREIFDMAMEYLSEDYSRKVGEIEHFVSMSQSFIESVDLQNGIYEEDAMKMLEEWEKKSDSIMLGGEKQQLIAHAMDPDMEVDLDQPLPVREKVKIGKEADFGKFFEEK